MEEKPYHPGQLPPKTEEWAKFTIRLCPSVHERTREIAYQCRMPVSFVIRELIDEGIKKYEAHMDELKKEMEANRLKIVPRETFNLGMQIALPL